MLADKMEHKDMSSSSSGSRTFPEGGEEDDEVTAATVDIKVSGDGEEDGDHSDSASVGEVEGGGRAKCDEETPGGEESDEEEDKDEKVNRLN